MKQEDQIKAIAKVMGKPEIHQVVGRGWVYGVRDGGVAREYIVPNYLGSLDAMHDVEKTLKGSEFKDYFDELCNLNRRPYHATAAQRSEAFLRTKGLWVEDEPKINPEWVKAGHNADVTVLKPSEPAWRKEGEWKTKYCEATFQNPIRYDATS